MFLYNKTTDYIDKYKRDVIFIYRLRLNGIIFFKIVTLHKMLAKSIKFWRVNDGSSSKF